VKEKRADGISQRAVIVPALEHILPPARRASSCSRGAGGSIPKMRPSTKKYNRRWWSINAQCIDESSTAHTSVYTTSLVNLLPKIMISSARHGSNILEETVVGSTACFDRNLGTSALISTTGLPSHVFHSDAISRYQVPS
jgi:hypothetical protein